MPIKFYSADELKAVENIYPISNFVKKTVVVGSVARPSAYLGSNRGKEIYYTINDGVTLAVYRKEEKSQ